MRFLELLKATAEYKHGFPKRTNTKTNLGPDLFCFIFTIIFSLLGGEPCCIGDREVIQQTAHNKFEFKKDKMRHLFLPNKVTKYQTIVTKYTIYVVNFEFYFNREGQKI